MVLVVIMRISSLELVVPRNYRTLGGVGHLVMEYVISKDLITFYTQYRSYKYKVLLFRLINGPAIY